MKRRKHRRLRRKILTGITYFEVLVMFLAMSGMDSPDLTAPIVMFLQAMAWLAIFFTANPDWPTERRRKTWQENGKFISSRSAPR